MKPPKAWADLLVDNVSCATQVRELPHQEDWRRNAEQLFQLAFSILLKENKPKREWPAESHEQVGGNLKTFRLVMFCEEGYEPYLVLREVGEELDRQREHVPAATKLNPRNIAEALDQDAENINAHMFCGVHIKLAELLHRRVGNKTKQIMMDLANQRGLHGLKNDCGCRD